MVVKAFVEFGHGTSHMKSSSHTEFNFENLIKNATLGACFHFIGLFCYKALTVKVEKLCKKKPCLKVVHIKCQR